MKLDLVQITWVDTTHYSEWMSFETAQQRHTTAVINVGYLLSKDDECYRLTPGITDDGGLFGVICIPSHWVMEIKVLKKSAVVLVKKSEEE